LPRDFPKPIFWRIRGYLSCVDALEGNEPAHVPLDCGAGSMKVWLDDVALASSQGLKPVEIRTASQLTREHREIFSKAWPEWDQGQREDPREQPVGAQSGRPPK
jgi:hypothetical protein